MDEAVKKYLEQKYADKLGDINAAQAFSNLGDVVAGNKVGSQSGYFSDLSKQNRADTLGAIERQNELDAKMAQAAETANYRNAMLQATLGRDAAARQERMAEKQMKREEQAKVPASIAQEIGGANASIKALKDAAQSFESNADISGPWQGLASRGAAQLEIGETGKRAKAFDAQLRMNAQMIGKYLEGGKMTDSDIERYKSMLPNLSDSKDIADVKIQQIQNMIAQKQQAEKEGLSQAGYKVQNLEVGTPGINPNVKGPEIKVINGKQYQKVQGGWQKVGQ